MKSKCLETGLPEPEITSHNGNVIVVFRFDKMLNGQPIENNGTLNESQRETFEYIRVNEGCNTSATAQGLGKPFRTIDKHINILLQLVLIASRGSKRTGGYYIK